MGNDISTDQSQISNQNHSRLNRKKHSHHPIRSPQQLFEDDNIRIISENKNRPSNNLHNSLTLSTMQNSPILSTMQNSPILSTIQNSPILSTIQNSPTLRTMQNVQQIITNQNSQNLNLTQYIPPFNLLHTSPPINTRTVQIIPNLSAMHNSLPLNIRAIQNTPALHIIQTNPSFGTILNSSPTRIMHNSSFFNTTKNIPPFNLIHNQPLFNQSTIFHQISNQHVLHESEQNTENKSRKRKKSKVDESEVYRYYIKHSLNRTKRRYHIGFDRLKQIIQHNGKYRHKRKTTVEIDDFIVELASSGRQALAISIEVEKKFHTYVSRQTVIRRLKENHFKYRRLFKVPELSESQILLGYNFASLFF